MITTTAQSKNSMKTMERVGAEVTNGQLILSGKDMIITPLVTRGINNQTLVYNYLMVVYRKIDHPFSFQVTLIPHMTPLQVMHNNRTMVEEVSSSRIIKHLSLSCSYLADYYNPQSQWPNASYSQPGSKGFDFSCCIGKLCF